MKKTIKKKTMTLLYNRFQNTQIKSITRIRKCCSDTYTRKYRNTIGNWHTILSKEHNSSLGHSALSFWHYIHIIIEIVKLGSHSPIDSHNSS